MAEHGGHHLGEHETSFWPFPVGLGILLTPIAIITYFGWQMQMPGLILGSVGVLLIIFGMIGWANEVFSKGHEEGLGTLAIAMFITTEVIIFGTMFVAFWAARISKYDIWKQWVPEINFVLPIILTLILWASSISILMAEKAMEKGEKGKSATLLIVTIALGVAFTIIHVQEWLHLWHSGFTLSSNMYGTGFYALTGIHTSHVIVGIVAQLYVLWLVLANKMTHHRTTLFKAVSMYWHFVDLMWLLVASTAYVIGALV